jgi:hypothetical protein
MAWKATLAQLWSSYLGKINASYVASVKVLELTALWLSRFSIIAQQYVPLSRICGGRCWPDSLGFGLQQPAPRNSIAITSIMVYSNCACFELKLSRRTQECGGKKNLMKFFNLAVG